MYKIREEWLNAGLKLISMLIAESSDAQVPANTRVSCGLAGGRIGAKRIGECWTVACSPDGTTQVFISPEIHAPSQVLAVLVHEAVHAAVGAEHGHKKPFAKVARAVGLEGKLTATYAGPALQTCIDAWIGVLGDYPHAGLVAGSRKKQPTRLLKVFCMSCGYTVRTTKKWVDMGTPLCYCNGEAMVVDGAEDSDNE